MRTRFAVTATTLAVLVGSGVFASTVTITERRPAPNGHTRSTGARPALIRVALADGLYVGGFFLDLGVSIDKVKAHFGPDDERYGTKDEVDYTWKMRDGSRLSLTFDGIGSMKAATLVVDKPGTLNPRTFVVLDRRRIIPGKVTLATVRRVLPQGRLGEVQSGEGFNFVDYEVNHGGEGSEVMGFGIGWDGMPDISASRQTGS